MVDFPSPTSAYGRWTLNDVRDAVMGGNWPAPVTPDPYFEYVTMLLTGDGTNGAQNNTFLDSSTNNFTITRNGNTTQGAFSPYGSNWSNYFDGNGDYFKIANNAAFSFGSGDLTFECWFYSNNSTGELICQPQTNSSAGDGVTLYKPSSGNVGFYASASSGSYQVAITGAVSENAWNHVAGTRSGNTWTLWINGVSAATATWTGTVTQDSTAGYGGIQIGATINNGINGSYPFTGYISNARVVKGTAVYTSNFTPSNTPLTAITNTQLLTCQSNRFIDNSANAFAITANGNVSVQRFSPFSPTAAYSAATIGGSAYFDGSGDYLTAADNTALELGSSDFTLECWIYDFSGASNETIVGKGWSSAANSFVVFVNGNVCAFYGSGNGSSWSIVSGANMGNVRKFEWTHLAVSRSGSNLYCFNNGALTSTTNIGSSAFFDGAGLFSIGSDVSGNYSYNGYISDVRLVKGTALYTSTFTPPTAPLSAVTNTSILNNFTNGAIFDNAMMNNLETVGNAQISTAQSKFGGGSMYFDGSGDYLTAPNRPWMRLANADFTIEFWMYLSAAQASMGIVGSYENNNGWFVRLDTTYIRFFAGNSQIVVDRTYSFSTGVWYNVAITRASNTIRVFVDGTQVGANASVTTATDTTTQGLQIGRTQTITNDFNGYIDDLRITNGYARYTANFTPSTTPFPTL